MLSDCAGPCTSTTTIINSTIFGNDGGTANSNGGGVLATAGTISLENSILATNTIGGGATASNCGSANISSLGHNIADGTGCPLTATGDHPSTNPQFLMQNPQSQSVFIADWGGNTDSFALKATSPAVDAVPAGSPGCTGTDQLDTPRPQGGGCDIGADEVFQPSRASSSPAFSTSIDPAANSGGDDQLGRRNIAPPEASASADRRPGRTPTPRRASTTERSASSTATSSRRPHSSTSRSTTRR